MKFEILERSDAVLKFSIKGISTGMANAIRRGAMGMTASFAIDSVTFYENTSAMFDEYIAHRIGLMPIITPSKGYSTEDQIMFTLDVTGPKTVYSADFDAADKYVKVANEQIPIMKLADGQKLRLDGKAVMCRGAKHAKFVPGLVTYNWINDNDNEYEFYVESFGQMPPREIINKAIEAIEEDIKELQKEAKKL